MTWTDLGQVVPNIEYIDIQASDYNPNIDDTITITITATNQSENPIANQIYTLKKNGEVLTTLTTNSNGVATYTYTCDDWGICRFSIKSFVAYINVYGWKLVYDSGGVKIRTNGKEASVSLEITNVSFSTSKEILTTIPSQYAPSTSIIHTRVHPNNRDAWIDLEDTTIYKWSSSANTINIYCTIPTYPLATPLY